MIQRSGSYCLAFDTTEEGRNVIIPRNILREKKIAKIIKICFSLTVIAIISLMGLQSLEPIQFSPPSAIRSQAQIQQNNVEDVYQFGSWMMKDMKTLQQFDEGMNCRICPLNVSRSEERAIEATLNARPSNLTDYFSSVAKLLANFSKCEFHESQRKRSPPTPSCSLRKIFPCLRKMHWTYQDRWANSGSQLPPIGFETFCLEAFVRVSALKALGERKFDALKERFKQALRQAPVIGAICIDNATMDEVLMVRSFGGYTWGFPQGKLEVQERPVDAAVREVMEECGIDISHELNPETYIQVYRNGRITRLYLVPLAKKRWPLLAQKPSSSRMSSSSSSSSIASHDYEIGEIKWQSLRALATITTTTTKTDTTTTTTAMQQQQHDDDGRNVGYDADDELVVSLSKSSIQSRAAAAMESRILPSSPPLSSPATLRREGGGGGGGGGGGAAAAAASSSSTSPDGAAACSGGGGGFQYSGSLRDTLPLLMKWIHLHDQRHHHPSLTQQHRETPTNGVEETKEEEIGGHSPHNDDDGNNNNDHHLSWGEREGGLDYDEKGAHREFRKRLHRILQDWRKREEFQRCEDLMLFSEDTPCPTRRRHGKDWKARVKMLISSLNPQKCDTKWLEDAFERVERMESPLRGALVVISILEILKKADDDDIFSDWYMGLLDDDFRSYCVHLIDALNVQRMVKQALA